MDPSRGDSRYNLNYSMSSIGLSLSDQADLYGNPAAAAALGAGGGRPPSGGLIQSMGGGGGGRAGGGNGGLMNSSQCQSLNNTGGNGQSRGLKRTSSDCYDDHHRGGSGGMTTQTLQGLESCGGGGGNGTNSVGQPGGNVSDVVDDSYASMQNKKSPPANGKKTKGRVKIKMEYIDNKLRRYTTFSKRKTGIMKKAYELSTLTGTQVMLLVASETGHVYTFATRKLQPMITSEAGKQLIQTCLNSPDPPSGGGGGDQRMSATGFEETELSYNIADEDSKDDRSPMSSGNESDDSSDIDSPGPPSMNNSQTILNDSPIQQDAHTHIGGGPSVSNHQQQSQPAVSLSATAALNSTSTTHYDNFKSNTNLSGQQSTINNVVYPASALANIPQEVLLGLVQSGHLQLHTEDDGSGHQYITIPLSMATATASSTSSSLTTLANTTASIGNSGGGNVQNVNSSTTSNNRNHGKNLSTKTSSSSSKITSNDREDVSPQPQSVIRIKKELID